MASLNFNSDDVPADEKRAYEPMPPGWYVGHVMESELKQNRKGTGSYLQFVIEVDSPEFKSRRLWARHTWEHDTSSVAVEIGHREVADLCQAVGKPKIADTNELHNLQFRVKVSLKDSPQYGPSNDVVGYKKLGTGGTVAATPVVQAPDDDDIPF